ncbi:Dynein heavy chain and region D6 of dynein motor [Carpediemonas membranifera]|uniref:Dynein heavy chain and region D6 of dynein motor n=1 Tax=Carpediemonas membranifera TaxID=201153 RepID=A0A8J6E146_9EUKA|nr:Dynein heavy chain and region D6 of dynein motor [Carpediemonas membranifera]|eukprot:KAG9395874.1 Dynein heavy chain and region D6 of dynein motor [Carpediemonas membranifera]
MSDRNPAHKWVFSRIALALNREPSQVAADARKNDLISKKMKDFFDNPSLESLVFYYTNEDKRLEISDLSDNDTKLTGFCMYFLKISNNPRALTTATLDSDVYFGTLPPVVTSEGRDGTILAAFQTMLDNVFMPFVKTADSPQTADFLIAMRKCITAIGEANDAISDRLELVTDAHRAFIAEKVDDKNRDAHIQKGMEILEFWTRSLHTFIRESNEIRQEDDTVGPQAELEYWRARMARFNHITDQLTTSGASKTHPTSVIKAVEGLVNKEIPRLAKNAEKDPRLTTMKQVIQNWTQVKAQAHAHANEASDTVKYLYTLERILEPLYRSDPVQMLEAIPPLMSAIQMMHSIARYYSKPEHMTGLFVKITNQMIVFSRLYLRATPKRHGTEPGSTSLWDSDYELLMSRFQDCVALNQVYQEQYRLTKAKLDAQPMSRKFDFSESQMFGNFDLFCNRIDQLRSVITTIHQFTTLQRCTVAGMGKIYLDFEKLVVSFQRKSYDVLDHRCLQFNTDYAQFTSDIERLEDILRGFIDDTFAESGMSQASTDHAISILKQFQGVLQRKSLSDELVSKVLLVFNWYGKELEAIRAQYESSNMDPPIARDLPPVSGAIAWCKNLLSQAEEPMEWFRQQDIMDHPDPAIKDNVARIVQDYNVLVAVFRKYCMAYHMAWGEQTRTDGLDKHLLARDDDDNLYVNFDRDLIVTCREAAWMESHGFTEIPDNIRAITRNELKLTEQNDQLVSLIEDVQAVTNAIPPECAGLMQRYRDMLDDAILPGVTTYTWSSLQIGAFIAKVRGMLDEVQTVASKITDILNTRVRHNLGIIAHTSTVLLPRDGQVYSVDEYVAEQIKHARAAAVSIESHSQLAEEAVNDILSLVGGKVDSHAADAFFNQCHDDTYVAIYTATYHSLRFLLARLPAITTEEIDPTSAQPLFSVSLELRIPQYAYSPSLNDVGTALTEIVQSAIGATKRVYRWSQARPPPTSTEVPEGLESFFTQISQSPTITKQCLVATGRFARLKTLADTEAASYKVHNHLWKDNKNDVYKAFLDTSPTVDQFGERIAHYSALQSQLEAKPDVSPFSVLSINIEPLKLTLLNEVANWKKTFATNLNERARADLLGLASYMSDIETSLSRTVKDLDDVRAVMDSLGSLREIEAEIDHRIVPLEEMYAMLSVNGVHVSTEETEAFDQLRYRWSQLTTLGQKQSDHISDLQPVYKKELTASVTQFTADVSILKADYDERGPMVPGLSPRVAADRLKEFQAIFDEKERLWLGYTAGEELFGLPQTDFPELVQMKKELKLLNALYSLYSDVLSTVSGYADVLWLELNIESISNQMGDFQTRCRRLPKGMRDWDAFLELKKVIDDFSETLPLIQMLANPAMRPRHWNQLGELCNTKFDVDGDQFKLHDLTDAPLLENKDEVEDICNAAVKETDIEAKLKAVEADWVDQEFVFATFKTRGELTLAPAETSELITLLEDTQMLLGALVSNRYNAPFKKDIMLWVARLSTASEVIEQWLQVQALWIYLEAVFSGGDIARQLPLEAKRFATIDKTWVKIMQTAQANPNVVNVCYADDTLRNLLPHLSEQLELCQKSLSGYLETKRNLYPRFYFVSDPVLLEILGQQSDPHSIQAHIQSLFDSVFRVTFDKVKRTLITGLVSPQGEELPLSAPVEGVGNIEDWLNELVASMQTTVHDVIREAAVQVHAMPLEDFINAFPAQVSLLGIQLLWTHICDTALANSKSDKNAMTNASKQNATLLGELVRMTMNEMSKRARTGLETLITIQVHQKDITDDLLKRRIRSPADFEWLKQTRFYYRTESDECIISITDIDFDYAYEYLGVAERLVITPLTDRCYITLAQALGMYLGGAPAGPAGTGKTETVKDMGRSLGTYVVVFNCSDQMDYRGLGKIFRGLAQCGCFGCFDEFNRIELEVLSVAAQQVGCILAALKEHKKEFVFTDGQTVPLLTTCGYFITMNPGYAGRQELPENLKALFRSVSMMVPDREIIMRVKLASAGFSKQVELAKKFYILYRLCEEQLSGQRHYDFGLRNILSVLRSCGTRRRTYPDQSEDQILMQVLRDMNLSKLVDEDVQLFLSLISDLFPGQNVRTEAYPELEAAIQKVVENLNIINHDDWRLRVIQLYETALVRHGIMVLGPSGAGKSANINTLAGALTECGDKHVIVRMNPKAITASQMFGKLDAATNDWTDGIFAALWRKATRRSKENTWLVLDGPVDAVWIENLNTVLDDNKTLTLANSDRIPMTPLMKLIFEVDSLANASPATVSRNGMVYMSDKALGWKPLFEAWVASRSRQKGTLAPLFDKFIDDVTLFIRDHTTPVIDMPSLSPGMSVMALIDALDPVPKDNEEQKRRVEPSADHLERIFFFALMWGIAGNLETKDQDVFHKYFTTNPIFKGFKVPKPNSTHATVYDYYVDAESGDWAHWSTKVPEFSFPETGDVDFHSVVIPTVDNVRSTFLLNALLEQQQPVLFVGESGTAKTVTVLQYLESRDTDAFMCKTINFSSATTMGMVQGTIESYVEKRMGSIYGPPANKRGLFFIDNISAPNINEWGDTPTNEIVRQIIAEKGMYALDRPGDWHTLADMLFMGALPCPGGGRNDLPDRLKRQFVSFSMALPGSVQIDRIYGTILGGFFNTSRGFSTPVIDTVKKLVVMTREVWSQTKIKMLPTPAKFHYIFNLRDLSRVSEGLLLATPEVVNTPEIAINMWVHEMTRVIPDKFTTQADMAWFAKALEESVEKTFGSKMVGPATKKTRWVDFMRDAPEIDDPDEIPEIPKIYEPVDTLEELKDRLSFYQEQYNEVNRRTPLSLVLFEAAVDHICRISRIIRLPRGNALLVGVGGSGKQSLTRLASFVAGYETFQITITRGYNASSLEDDLKLLYRKAGVEGVGTTFIFTDNEIQEEGFLEYINNFLMSGEIPGLFPKDEMEQIYSDVRPILKANVPRAIDTNDNIWKYFIERVRCNLHICLCFSPVGDKFRTRARFFPGIVSCPTDWFQPWPQEALVEVARRFLDEFEMDATPEVKDALILHISGVHSKMNEVSSDYFNRYRRYAYVTPKSYLSFLDSFKSLYTKKRGEIGVLADRLNVGLNKLIDAGDDVAKMKVELVQKERDLEVAQKQAAEMLKEITASTAVAEKVKSEVQKVKDDMQVVADEIASEKAKAEKHLEAAIPALEAAEQALNQIKPADIATLKKLAKPPNLIMRIMDGVLILRNMEVLKTQQDPDKAPQHLPVPSWKGAQKMMNDTAFLNSLLTFPKDEITDETVELLQPYFDMDDFTFEAAKKVSGNVAGLCSWCIAMGTYHNIAKEVEPLREKVRNMEEKYSFAMKDLAKAQAELDEKQAQLDELTAKYDAAMAEKQRLQDDADLTRRRMTAANALINGLSGEKARWTQQSKEFAETIRKLVGDVVIASAFMSYCGPYNQAFRHMLMTEMWTQSLVKLNIPFTEGIGESIHRFLVSESKVGEWNLQGLPTDVVSTQNGIMVTSSTRYPLLVDPQGQSNDWIKCKEKDNNLRVTTLDDKFFRNYLEDALNYGTPILIEGVEETLDPLLDPVLEKQFVKSGRGFKVRVGDKECDVTDGFMLYITTKLPRPHYSPEISAKTSVIDFTVTMVGLTEQLLTRVVNKEKQELELQRRALLEDVNANKKMKEQLESDLLERLSSTQGNLLDDETLIDVLAQTKKTAQEVDEKLSGAVLMERKINEAREEFRPVAVRGSILYFLIAEMAIVSHMYQTSLTQFLELFDTAIDAAEPNQITAKRIMNILNHSTFTIFLYIQRGLFERDKNLFVLQLCLKIDLDSGAIDMGEFQAFSKGGAALDIATLPNKPNKWLPDSAWLHLNAVKAVPVLSRIVEVIKENDNAWRAWYDSETPESEVVPGLEDKLTPFHKLLLVRCMREDRTMLAATGYIISSLGQRYAEGQPLNIEATWQESSPKVPLLCILSLGSDPTSQIEAVAKKQKIPISAISMGQGQEIHARRLFKQCVEQGGWLLLSNSHLGLKFMHELVSLVNEVDAATVHPTFRVWVTTEPHNKFPIGLLQMSIKFSNEPPSGVKAGLRRTYQWVTQDVIEAVDKPEWGPMLYTLTFLHTVLQERRKYKPIGLCIPYEFNQSDLASSVQFIQTYMYQQEAGKAISWSTIRYMIAEVLYGGRVTDNYDRRLLAAFGLHWFDNKMFDDDFAFFPGYTIPGMKNVAEVRNYVETLPLLDNPEIFGMHSNAELTYRMAETKEIIEKIIMIQPKDVGGGGGETREEAVMRIAGEILSKLPADYDIHVTRDHIKRQGGYTIPLNVFLGQEIDKLQVLLGTMRQTLVDLRLAIQGTIIMSAPLQASLDALFDARVPPHWLKLSWPSATLGFWLADMLKRCEQNSTWLETGRPKAYWLAGFYNPQGFLTAVRQEITRAHQGWALDSVVINTTVLRTEDHTAIHAGPQEGVYIYGLSLDGAGWSKKTSSLVDAPPKVLSVPLPILHVSAQNTPLQGTGRMYRCPVYTLPSRCDINFVFDVYLPTSDPPIKWILRGAALLTTTNE